MAKELHRAEVDTMTHKPTCLRCGKEVTLFFNGGEGDRKDCCGLTYSMFCEKMVYTVTDETDEQSEGK